MTVADLHRRIEAAFLCLAVTDALGGPLEFGPRIADPSLHVTTMLPNHNFSIGPGHFTDDTSMALCLASSLLETGCQSDVFSQARAYVRWHNEGWMSSVPSTCFDIGNQTARTLSIWARALDELRLGIVDVEEKARETQALIIKNFSKDICCGNGSLMRVLPCALMAATEDEAVKLAKASSLITHPHQRCVDACLVYTTLVFRALRGASKNDLFETLRSFAQDSETEKFDSKLRACLQMYTTIDTFHQKPISEIESSGYVLHSLEAALWVFFTTDTYEQGAIKVVNLGGDADTIGAIYGGLAGAFYGGEEVIPKDWIEAMEGLNIVRGVTARIIRRCHSEKSQGRS